MRAIVFDECGSPQVLKVREVEDPKIKPDEVLIRVEATGVTGRDLLIRRGRDQLKETEKYLGFECSGTIEQTGALVTKWKAGDEVCALLDGGGYAELVAVPEEYIMNIPAAFTLSQAAAIPSAASLIWLSFFRKNDLAYGDKVLIHDAGGGFGWLAIRMAKSRGCTVFATAGSQEMANFCVSLGADFGINHKAQDFSEVVASNTGGTGVQYILDNVGAEFMGKNLKSLGVGGKLISVGYEGVEGAFSEVDFGYLVTREIQIMGIDLHTLNRREKEIIADGIEREIFPLLRYVPNSQIFQTYQFADAAQVHKLIESNSRQRKILLVPGGRVRGLAGNSSTLSTFLRFC